MLIAMGMTTVAFAAGNSVEDLQKKVEKAQIALTKAEEVQAAIKGKGNKGKRKQAQKALTGAKEALVKAGYALDLQEAKDALIGKINLEDADAKNALEGSIKGAPSLADLKIIENDDANKDAFKAKEEEKAPETPEEKLAKEFKEANDNVVAKLEEIEALKKAAIDLAKEVSSFDAQTSDVKKSVDDAVEAINKVELQNVEDYKNVQVEDLSKEKIEFAKDTLVEVNTAFTTIKTQSDIVEAKVLYSKFSEKIQEKSDLISDLKSEDKKNIKQVILAMKKAETKDAVTSEFNKLFEGENCLEKTGDYAKFLEESYNTCKEEVESIIIPKGNEGYSKHFNLTNAVISTVVIAALCQIKAVFSTKKSMTKYARIQKKAKPGFVDATKQTFSNQLQAVKKLFGFGKSKKVAVTESE